jgi:hypothetical protein
MELGGTQLKEAVLDLIAKLKEEWDVQIVRRQVYTEEEVKEKDMTIERLTQDLEEVFATLGELCILRSITLTAMFRTDILFRTSSGRL